MIKENDIVTFKMTSGDEVIAKIIKINEFQGYEVYKPLGVMIAQQGFGLVPWILSGDDKENVHIAHDAIASMVKTQERVASEYNRQTSSIVVPPKSGLVL